MVDVPTILTAPTKKVQQIQMQAPATGGLSFARKQETGVKSMGAKKLDVDFGSDDFFNQFQPAPV